MEKNPLRFHRVYVYGLDADEFKVVMAVKSAKRTEGTNTGSAGDMSLVPPRYAYYNVPPHEIECISICCILMTADG